MSRIKQLSPSEAQKIAAGEVVERPANVVKELIENALDAQATNISIYIEDAGKQKIRIVDNGHGMSSEDAYLCFKHHTTSKITCVDDLQQLQTFGFRGEALSSISSVSKVTLSTKEPGAAHGTQLYLEQSAVVQEKEIQCNPGTDICIEELFYNVPARKKFLKTKETEWRQIVLLFQAFCLDYQNIHFKLFSENKMVLNCPPVTTLMERIAQLYEQPMSSSIVPLVQQKKDSVTVTGAISNHQYYKYDRSSIFFFVNNRWVKNQKLASALLKGYLQVLPHGRFPCAFIFITLDASVVDINIHPRKEEVQFLNPRIVEQLISQAVKETLEQNLSAQFKQQVQLAPAAFEYQPRSFAPEPFFASAPLTTPFAMPKTQSFFEQEPFASLATTTNNVAAQHDLVFGDADITEREQTEAVTAEKNYTLIGQLNKTYLLLEKEEGLFVVDQHAAHERILYEQFANRFNDVATISLLFPQIITVTQENLQLLEPHLPVMQTNGIAIEHFGEDQLVVNATPVHLKNVNLQELVNEMIGWITELNAVDKTTFSKTIHEKLHAQMACKAAVKAGDVLTTEQMHQLLNDLEKTANRFTCPHGRPTGWLLSTYEIEKKFKRKL